MDRPLLCHIRFEFGDDFLIARIVVQRLQMGILLDPEPPPTPQVFINCFTKGFECPVREAVDEKLGAGPGYGVS